MDRIPRRLAGRHWSNFQGWLARATNSPTEENLSGLERAAHNIERLLSEYDDLPGLYQTKLKQAKQLLRNR